MIADFISIFIWWAVLFFIGVIFLPLTAKIFAGFFDRGYIFAKILGMLIISYAVFVLGTLRILPFSQITVITIIIIITIIILLIFFRKMPPWSRWHLVEEIIFLAALLFWSFIRGFEPSIHGLEKYMDFGFVNSILRTDYFPAKDMWYSPLSINYYYFGHLVTAVLTKLSGIDSTVTFNLMIATLFAFTLTASFSIGANLINLKSQISNLKSTTQNLKLLVVGLLTAFLVTFAGNLHTIYAFFSSYNPDLPVPFWQLKPLLNLSSYWYPNATRFIPFTIHEFPIYSFVVSDLHGHVLSIPIVLTLIAVLLSLAQNLNLKSQIHNLKLKTFLLAFLLAAAYMTNAWDGIIYAGLTGLVFIYLAYKSKNYTLYAIRYTLIIIGSILFSLPFSLYFKPFVSGIGIVKDHSPLYMLAILWGFFYFWVISFVVFIRKKLNAGDIFVLLLIGLSTLLIIIPEFFYAKDIYPAHYRANTMFKLGYQAFIILSIATGYVITRIITNFKFQISNFKLLVVFVIGSIGLLLVIIYPFFAVNSYYGGLKDYKGLDGLSYFGGLYPTDYQAILWLRQNVKGQPIILEANGDSYTDYARVSANTGLPTVIGWPVHEWLWRGSYDVASPRIADVQTLYENKDINLTKELIRKYNISLIFVGELERQKYQNIREEKFKIFGKPIYQNEQTVIYQLGNYL